MVHGSGTRADRDLSVLHVLSERVAGLEWRRSAHGRRRRWEWRRSAHGRRRCWDAGPAALIISVSCITQLCAHFGGGGSGGEVLLVDRSSHLVVVVVVLSV